MSKTSDRVFRAALLGLTLFSCALGAGFPFSFWKTASGGGTPTWVYTNTNSTTDFGGLEVFSLLTPIVADKTGTCTKIAIWVRFKNAGTNFKIALMDASRNILTSQTVDGSSASDGAYFEITLGSPQSVTNTNTYHIAAITQTDSFRFGADASPTAVTNADFSETYAGFPTNPAPAGSPLSNGMRVGMYIVP